MFNNNIDDAENEFCWLMRKYCLPVDKVFSKKGFKIENNGFVDKREKDDNYYHEEYTNFKEEIIKWIKENLKSSEEEKNKKFEEILRRYKDEEITKNLQ